ncbi:MAG: CARDB domain-containing protein, partial [Candidatus Micrarchaeota archaeon]
KLQVTTNKASVCKFGYTAGAKTYEFACVGTACNQHEYIRTQPLTQTAYVTCQEKSGTGSATATIRPPATCTDSDGDNQWQAGSVTDENGITHNDACILDNTAVDEQVCDQNGRWTHVIRQCAFGCAAGACKNEPGNYQQPVTYTKNGVTITCTKTDGFAAVSNKPSTAVMVGITNPSLYLANNFGYTQYLNKWLKLDFVNKGTITCSGRDFNDDEAARTTVTGADACDGTKLKEIINTKPLTYAPSFDCVNLGRGYTCSQGKCVISATPPAATSPLSANHRWIKCILDYDASGKIDTGDVARIGQYYGKTADKLCGSVKCIVYDGNRNGVIDSNDAYILGENGQFKNLWQGICNYAQMDFDGDGKIDAGDYTYGTDSYPISDYLNPPGATTYTSSKTCSGNSACLKFDLSGNGIVDLFGEQADLQFLTKYNGKTTSLSATITELSFTPAVPQDSLQRITTGSAGVGFAVYGNVDRAGSSTHYVKIIKPSACSFTNTQGTTSFGGPFVAGSTNTKVFTSYSAAHNFKFLTFTCLPGTHTFTAQLLSSNNAVLASKTATIQVSSPQIVPCTDSDASLSTLGRRLATRGTCTDTTGTHIDSSVDSYKVKEYYCGPQYVNGQSATPTQQTCLTTTYTCTSYGYTRSSNGACTSGSTAITAPSSGVTTVNTPVSGLQVSTVVVPTKPDISIKSLEYPTTGRVMAGAKAGYKITIAYDKRRINKQFSVQAYLDGNPLRSERGYFGTNTDVLEFTETQYANTGLTANNGRPHTITVKVDSNNDIAESNENNNQRSFAVYARSSGGASIAGGVVSREAPVPIAEVFVNWLRDLSNSIIGR